MTDIDIENYERALSRVDSFHAKVKNGGTTMSQEKERASLVKTMIRFRDRLIATGKWEGPIPMKSKAKYRNG